MGGYDSVTLYKIRKLLAELSGIKGRGTELVSLYIPPSRPVHDVINILRDEYSTASNIKSDTTRTHVQGALTKIVQRLKLYKKLPPTGLAIFCGAVPKPGKELEEFVLYEVVPPKSINTFLYRCDDHFHLEILRDMIRETEVIGVISIDSSEAGIGVIRGNMLTVVDVITSGVGSKHRQGGQSARRFERLREAELEEFFNRVAKHAVKALLEEYPVKKLIISGPGPTKEEFYKGEYMDYRLQKAVIGLADTSYSGEEGVRETLERAKDLLRDTRLIEEKTLIEGFLKEASRPDGLATYGLHEVMGALEAGAADMVMVSEDIDTQVVEFTCNRCGYKRMMFVNVKDVYGLLSEEMQRRCPRCGNVDWSYRQLDLVDYIYDKAQLTGTKVEIVSSKTEYGQMFKSFGGLGAMLRYRSH